MSRSSALRNADLPQLPVTSSAHKTWSQPRLAGGLVLIAWAVLFWWLYLSGRVNLYLSTRTSWVVPIGASLLTASAIGRVVAARASDPEALRVREAVVMALMVVPVIVVMVLPAGTLGSFSAAKKTPFSSVTLSQSFYDQITSTSEITLLSVAAGETSTEGARALAKRAGSDVDFVGIVSHDSSMPADEFMLTRYVITCCVADATIVQVRVVNVVPGAVQPDTWAEVKGQIYPLGRSVIVSAGSVRTVPRPARPYLTP
jgi:uncharacterized repeat protein (TIGR03943 family)